MKGKFDWNQPYELVNKGIKGSDRVSALVDDIDPARLTLLHITTESELLKLATDQLQRVTATMQPPPKVLPPFVCQIADMAFVVTTCIEPVAPRAPRWLTGGKQQVYCIFVLMSAAEYNLQIKPLVTPPEDRHAT